MKLPADLPARPTEPTDGEALTCLDEAVNALGERHRRVVVLCYLQGHTADDAARLLGVPRGTVLSRLATARRRLAKTLTRRGVTLPALLTATTLSYDRVSACVARTLDPRTAAPAAAIAQGVLTMMVRAKLALTATALTAVTAVTLGVAGTGHALMPQAGGDQQTPAKAAPPAANPVAAMQAITAEIAAAEQKLAESVREWKQDAPKPQPSEVRAKTELLGAIDLIILKLDVDIREAEIDEQLNIKRIEERNRKTITEDEMIRYAGQYGSTQLKQSGIELKRIILQSRNPNRKLEMIKLDDLPENLREQYTKLKAEYLVSAAKEIDAINEWYRESRTLNSRNNIDALKATIKSKQQTKSIYAEKRQQVAAELAKLEAEQSEPAAVVAARQRVEAMRARHPELFDPATRSAAAMEKLTAELAELRAEVRRFRESK